MTTGSKIWASVVILGIVVLGALAITGNSKSDAAKRAAVAAEANARIAQRASERTECIRGIAAQLDHARWALIGRAFNAKDHPALETIGRQLDSLPLITDLADTGGMILGESVKACPPAPAPTLTKGLP